MMQTLKSLEPRKAVPNEYLLEELDEVQEIIFFTQGMYQIGYSINKKESYPLKYNGCNVLGAYGITFNKRSNFIY